MFFPFLSVIQHPDDKQLAKAISFSIQVICSEIKRELASCVRNQILILVSILWVGLDFLALLDI